MNKESILKCVDFEAAQIWRELCRLYPRLRSFVVPEIRLNNRLWRSAGFCYQQQNRIELGTKFFLYSQDYADQMIEIILPHEIIHQADYYLHGESDLKCGHGTNWRTMMQAYGLAPEPFHSMEIKR